MGDKQTIEYEANNKKKCADKLWSVYQAKFHLDEEIVYGTRKNLMSKFSMPVPEDLMLIFNTPFSAQDESVIYQAVKLQDVKPLSSSSCCLSCTGPVVLQCAAHTQAAIALALPPPEMHLQFIYLVAGALALDGGIKQQ